MKVKTSPMVAPSPERRRWAKGERPFFRSRKLARLPAQLAGESRKIWRVMATFAHPGAYCPTAPARKTNQVQSTSVCVTAEAVILLVFR